MKSSVLMLVAALAVLPLLAAAPAHAQGQDVIEVHVPFPFVVENTTLPAGTYYIGRVDPADPGAMQLESQDQRTNVFFTTNEDTDPKPPEQSEIVFDELGGHHFLSEVRNAGEGTIYQANPGHLERKLDMEDGVMGNHGHRTVMAKMRRG